MQRREQELAKEAERIELERTREEKLRQSIRENSSELRELEKKLNYAYMNKERALQIQEKVFTKQLDKVNTGKRYHFVGEEQNKKINTLLSPQRRKKQN